MTKDELLSAGFKRFEPNNGEYCTDLYQLLVRAESKLLYAVNVYRWQFPEPTGASYHLDVHFYLPDTECFRVKRHVESAAVAMSFCAEVYEKLGRIPDVLNND